MNLSNTLHRRLPDRAERLATILGTTISYLLFALLFLFATTRVLVFTSILIGPCVLVLTWFAFGGDIPLKLRQKGCRRFVLIPIVFWISFVLAFTLAQFGHLNPD